MNHSLRFYHAVKETAEQLSWAKVGELTTAMVELRKNNGRLFILGVGGSAANASHAVNDLRKLCGIEAYAPTDNVALLTAITNDMGWHFTFMEYLRQSNLTSDDAILVLSVGGGNAAKNVSVNIVDGCLFAKHVGAKVFAIVGRADGYAGTMANCAVVIPNVQPDLLTPIAESFQSIILHAIVSSPELAIQRAKWESMA